MDMSVAIIPIMGLALPIVLVPTIMGLKQARIERELEHAERMKAMELGRTLPKDQPWWSPARISLAFGVALPIGVFTCGAWASSHTHVSPTLIWLPVGIVGLAGVLSGAALAYRHIELNATGRGEVDPSGHKPLVEADAFDVVGSRG